MVVIDDADDLRLLLRYVLQGDPMFTFVGDASDGQAGVDLCRAEQPDVVLLDLSMPVMDGLEALPLIREAVPGVAIVVLSGFTATAMGQKAMELGAKGYLEKGVAATELVASLRTILDPARVETSTG